MLKNRYGNQVEIDLSMPEPIQQFESEEQDENNDTMNDANNQQLDSGDMLRIVTWRVFFLVFFFFLPVPLFRPHRPLPVSQWTLHTCTSSS